MAEASVHPRDSKIALLKSFREYESGIAYSNARRTALFSAVFMLLASSLDWVIIRERFMEFLIIRAVCALLVGIIYFALAKSRSERQVKILAQGITLLPLVSICLMIAETEGGNSTYYAGLNLILVGLSLLLRWSFWNTLGTIVLTFVCYIAAVMYSPAPTNFEVVFGNFFFLAVTSVFVLAGSYFYEKLRFSEYSLRMEVERSRELLESQNRQLSELDEAKTRFFANISHELRTPLTIMLGITERLRHLLAQPSAEPVVQEMTLMLEQNGLRLLKLIDDLLDLVRFDTGHATVNRQPTAICAHIEGLLRSLRHLAEQDRVALLWECETEYETILLDRDKFDKILLNLVINAVKFTPSNGTIEVKIAVTKDELHMTVEDSGVGIPPEVLPRIFERFWQVDTSSTRKFQGAGIGLALVRSLTEALAGRVSVDSSLGRGTIFSIELPVEPTTKEIPLLVEENPLKGGGKIADLHRRAALSIPGKMATRTEQLVAPPPRVFAPPVIGERSSGARPLVLIADDEPDIRRFLRMQLTDVDIIEASDGAEALELTRLRRPQLALLDHMMPEMDGVEVCRKIRENHTTRGVAVIILTARADETTKLSALQAGANDFLTKPFSTAELALRLENQIVMARVRREIMDLNSELHAAIEQIKENEVMMVRNEKLSALGRMSAGIIHEINNPLNYAGAGLHALETFTPSLPSKDQADFVDILSDVKEGVDRVSQIVIDLRKFTRDDETTSGDADLAEIVGRSKRMVSHQIGKEIEFNLKSPGHALISGNPNQLVQVFINLLHNSIDAIEARVGKDASDPGRIDVAIEPSGEGWQVSVFDNGIGIPPENLQKIFDPFFTSKDVGKGMGLGLSITHQILRTHRATVEVDSRPGEFTHFRIAFPAPSYESNDQAGAESVLDPHF